jgi:hypothetical protein
MIASFDIGEKNFAYSIGTADKLIKFHHVNVLLKKSQSILESCKAISNVLASEDWSSCGKVIIEQQMRMNVRAQRIAQHVWTWFSIVMPDTRPEFVASSLKTQCIIGPNTLTNKSRKTWAIDYVTKILETRVDDENLTYLRTLKKRDDVCDTYLQLIAYSRRLQ